MALSVRVDAVLGHHRQVIVTPAFPVKGRLGTDDGRVVSGTRNNLKIIVGPL